MNKNFLTSTFCGAMKTPYSAQAGEGTHMMTTQPPRVGRPFAPVKDGDRVTLGVRVSADTKRKLEEEANRTGRSLSQEAELRVLQSFNSEEHAKTFFEVQSLAVEAITVIGDRQEKIRDELSDQKKKQESDKEDIWREIAEQKKRLIDLIELSKKEDVSK
jgi:hypothetical protein